MKKNEFETAVKELLDGLGESLKKATEEAKKETKTRDNFKVVIETINDGKGIKCHNNIDHMSLGGALSLLDTMDKLKETIFEKMPKVKEIYGSPKHEFVKTMFSLVNDLLSECDGDCSDCEEECDGDCDDDE